MKTRTLILAMLTALLADAAAGCPAELRVSGHRLFLPVEINGTATEALLDSGAEMTLVDAGFARRTGLVLAGSETARGTGGGTEEVSFAAGVTVAAAGVSLDDTTVAVLDLAELSERLIGEPLTVIVGRELFDSGRFFLDIESRRFCRGDGAATPPGVRLPLTGHRGIMQFPVNIDDLPAVQADFDLGNGSEVLIGRSWALANGLLEPGRIVGTRQGGGIGGAITRDVVRLERLTLAGVSFPDVLAAVDPADDAPAANVGVSILRHFAITIDFPEHAVWLAPQQR